MSYVPPQGSGSKPFSGAFACLTGQIAIGQIPCCFLTTAKYKNANVTSAKLADCAVCACKVACCAITTGKIGACQVTKTKLADCSVDSCKLDSLASITFDIQACAPCDPAADKIIAYAEDIDCNNEKWSIKMKKAGSVTPVQVA